jgi:TolB-like protein/Tfp pilus assembly protein PilF
MSFLGEIKRRRVFQVAVVYAVVAWLLVQIVDVVNEPLNLPGWFDTVVIVALAIGFPVAVILAWAFDITPQGVVRTADDLPGADESLAATKQPPDPAQLPAAESPKEALPNSVAVLPLDNLSPNPDDAYFSAGIHEEIITRLAKIKDLNVIARTSVMQYAGVARPISEIAAELRVGAVMEGSVRYAGDKVRVTGQLIDANDGTHLWTEVYDRDLEDIFAIQTDIATCIADALKAELAPSERESIEKIPTSSQEAYAAYLRAMAELQERGLELGGIREARAGAIANLDQALTIDPDFALAHVQRGRINVLSLNLDLGTVEDYATRRKEVEAAAIEDLEKALALDPSIGLAHATLARVHQYNWRGRQAREGYAKALELSPNDPEVLIDAAVFTAFTGEIDKGKELGRRALELDPNNGPRHAMNAMLYQLSGDYDESATGQYRAAALSPKAVIPREWLGHVERLRGNPAAALEHTRAAETLLQNIATITLYAELVYLYGMLGEREDAKRILRQIREFSKTRRIPIAAWVLCELGLGDSGRALEWLTVAADDPQPYEGYFGMMSIVTNYLHNPVLDEPRFKEVRERMGYRD